MSKRELWLDHTGLNLIRIVIGSYFMAIAIGLISGFDTGVLLSPFLGAEIGKLVGNSLLFCLSVLFMAGVLLRLSALMLALLLLSSSVVQTYFVAEPQAVSLFWRDLALVCAVLLCYSSLRRYEIRKAAVIGFRPFRRHGVSRRDRDIAPRRVRTQSRRRDRPEDASYDRVLRPLIAPTGHIRSPEDLDRERNHHIVDGQGPRRTHPALAALPAPAAPDDDDDCDNIFANL